MAFALGVLVPGETPSNGEWGQLDREAAMGAIVSSVILLLTASDALAQQPIPAPIQAKLQAKAGPPSSVRGLRGSCGASWVGPRVSSK